MNTKIQKLGNRWTANGKPIDSYELYAVYGASINKRPAEIAVADVKNFLTWQKNPNRFQESLGAANRTH